MKWAYSIRSKWKVSLLLAVVMVLVMVNNLVERRHLKSLKNDFKEIYQDRLLAEGYIFQVYDHLYHKSELLMLKNFENGHFRNPVELGSHQRMVSQLMQQYGETYLTSDEQSYYEDLKSQLEQLQVAENKLLAGIELPDPQHDIDQIRSITRKCMTTLTALSAIQLSEGKVLERRSSKTFMGSISTSHFEMSILIFIALMIQVLVISGKPIAFTHNPGLN